MSLLSDPSGRPERVWSLLRLLAAFDEPVPRDQVDAWLMPAPLRDRAESVVQVHNTVGCARSLGLISDDDGIALALDGPPPPSLPGFLDLVHARLCDPPNPQDRVVLAAYACTIALTERDGGSTEWLTRGSETIAARINAALSHDAPGEGRQFNTSRAPAWRAWLVALGLAVDGAALPYLYPQPAARLARELPAIAAEHGLGVEIPAGAFLEAVARRMPYLDGGAVLTEVAAACGYAPRPGRVSTVLGEALRDLDDDGLIELRHRADAADAVSLPPEPGARLGAFVGVTIREAEG